MGTYYITPTGLSQKDLVAFLKDLETAFGGTNTTGYITTTTTADVTKWYDANVAVSTAVADGSAFASAISAQVSAGVVEVLIPSRVMSYNNSGMASTGASGGASAGASSGSSAAASAASSAGSLALSQGTSGGVSAVTSVVITPEAAGASIVSAGGNLASAVSAMISGGAGGGHISFLSHLCSKLVSHSI